jgi:hypothetical protein
MKSWWGALAVVAALGCGHAKSTERVSGSGKDDNGSADEHASNGEAGKGNHDEPPHDGSGAVAGEHAHAKPEIQKPGHPPVASHADQLLEPGAEKKIRDKLAGGHYLPSEDAPLAEGLKKFQAAHDMPATGVADTETVRRLGLDPGQIFRDAGH